MPLRATTRGVRTPKQNAAWRRLGRLEGRDVGAMRRKVFVCKGCGLWHVDHQPAQCHNRKCGRLDFDAFDSIGECKRWYKLLLAQRAGDITDLERQVPLELLAFRDGLPVAWGKMVVDFVFKDRKGVKRYLDHKPSEGITREASLKIRCLAAQGITIELITEKGEV